MKGDKSKTLPEIVQCACGCAGKLRKSREGFIVRCLMLGNLCEKAAYPTARKAIEAWNCQQEQMDPLTRDAIAAQRAGLSYGKYMAQKGEKAAAVRYPKEVAAEAPQVPALRCSVCGKVLPDGHKSRKYCSAECAEEGRLEQRRIRRMLDKEELVLEEEAAPPAAQVPELVCILCGKPIPAQEARRKYCSGACADLAREAQVRESNERRRSGRRSGRRPAK